MGEAEGTPEGQTAVWDGCYISQSPVYTWVPQVDHCESGTGVPQSILPLRVLMCQAGRERQSPSQVEPSLIQSECWEHGVGRREEAFFRRLRGGSLRPGRWSLPVHTVLFDGGCEYIHFIQGEPGIL